MRQRYQTVHMLSRKVLTTEPILHAAGIPLIKRIAFAEHILVNSLFSSSTDASHRSAFVDGLRLLIPLLARSAYSARKMISFCHFALLAFIYYSCLLKAPARSCHTCVRKEYSRRAHYAIFKSKYQLQRLSRLITYRVSSAVVAPYQFTGLPPAMVGDESRLYIAEANAHIKIRLGIMGFMMAQRPRTCRVADGQ